MLQLTLTRQTSACHARRLADVFNFYFFIHYFISKNLPPLPRHHAAPFGVDRRTGHSTVTRARWLILKQTLPRL